MQRWGVPLVVVGVLFAAGLWVAFLPVEADHHDCGGSAIAIVTGADVPDEHADECHHEARVDALVAALPTGAAVLGAILTVAILRGARPAT